MSDITGRVLEIQILEDATTANVELETEDQGKVRVVASLDQLPPLGEVGTVTPITPEVVSTPPSGGVSVPVVDPPPLPTVTGQVKWVRIISEDDKEWARVRLVDAAAEVRTEVDVPIDQAPTVGEIATLPQGWTP